MQRVFLYDPNYPDGWGGIQVRADANSPLGDVNVGAWISLENVLVSDPAFNEADPYKARGNTILFYDSSSPPAVSSIGNALPKPLVVDVNDVAVVYNPDDDTCYVTDHRAEKYEGMYIQVRDVTIVDVNVGKEPDNYSLNMSADPNIYCWASDYMNVDNPDDKTPLPIIQSGQDFFCSISGILEQYTKIDDEWDYYQILTTTTGDLQIEQTGNLDGDCDVDFIDHALFSTYWLSDVCGEPDWCGGTDFVDSRNGFVDANDLKVFTDNWLVGTK